MSNLSPKAKKRRRLRSLRNALAILLTFAMVWQMSPFALADDVMLNADGAAATQTDDDAAAAEAEAEAAAAAQAEAEAQAQAEAEAAAAAQAEAEAQAQAEAEARAQAEAEAAAAAQAEAEAQTEAEEEPEAPVEEPANEQHRMLPSKKPPSPQTTRPRSWLTLRQRRSLKKRPTAS